MQSQWIHNLRGHSNLLIKFNKELRNDNSCPRSGELATRNTSAQSWQYLVYQWTLQNVSVSTVRVATLRTAWTVLILVINQLNAQILVL